MGSLPYQRPTPDPTDPTSLASSKQHATPPQVHNCHLRLRRFTSLLLVFVPHQQQLQKMLREVIDKQVLELKKLWANKRQLLFQCLNLAMIVFSALMIWKGLMFVTKVRGGTAGLQGVHQMLRSFGVFWLRSGVVGLSQSEHILCCFCFWVGVQTSSVSVVHRRLRSPAASCRLSLANWPTLARKYRPFH